MYFHVNFNLCFLFKLIKVHLLVSELYIYSSQNKGVCSVKQYEKAEVKFHSSLTSALDGTADQLHAPAVLPE